MTELSPENRSAPATSPQAGLWFIHQTDPQCGAYHLLFSAEVTTDAEHAVRAEEILRELMAEHDALRVSFHYGEDGPIQRVESTVPLDIRHHDARAIEAQTLRRRIRSDSREAFDLKRPPLWRIHLYQTGEHTWIVVVVAHHIAFDLWSMAVLLDEVRSRMQGTVGNFTPDGAIFAEYADEQQAYLASEQAAERISREVARLGGAPTSLDLFGDKTHPKIPSYDGGSVPVTLPPEVSEQINVLARKTHCTPYVVVLTAYLVMLSRMSGQSEILVGTPTAGRLERKYRNAIGNFVNTVVVRGLADEDLSYRQLLETSRERVLEALRGQELPFPALVRGLAPERDPSRTPLFQAALAWDRLPFGEDMGQFFLLEPDTWAAVTVAGATLRPYPLRQQEGQTDLWLEMGGKRNDSYVGVLRYNSDIFTHATARELAESFVATITSLIERPDEPVRNLSRGNTRQDEQLAAWGAGPARSLPDATLPKLIRARSGRTPNATALVGDNETWSYARLQSIADAISAALRSAGVERNDRVAVMVDRGPVLVAAMLGVLGAGAAYVPLDPKLPAERVAYMTEDSGARLLLSEEALRANWSQGIPVCRLDDVLTREEADHQPLDASVAEQLLSGPSDPAYVLYTSGSTGRPKGVAIPHVALVNLLVAFQDETRFSASDSMLAVTTISFDIAGLELFLPLISGGRVILCDSGTAADGSALADLISASGATWMQATPTTWRMLRDAGWRGASGLNVLCGGEDLPQDLADYLTDHVASVRNVYGPTETTIWSTAGAVRSGHEVDLGLPLANTQLYVLDPCGRRVEPGFPGELHIGGTGVAIGYWDRPELTAERFKHGLRAAAESRLYRTGDRVRWTGDGRLRYHGRLDTQVKLRGYRIELGEVEAGLHAIDGVATAVAAVREDQLVAYVVPEPTVDLKAAAVKSAVALSLPRYMVPNVVVVLSELPVTANNKIDRKRLPAPVVAGEAPFEEPRDAFEITLARIWRDVLKLPRVGIRDNFFDLGGHSVLAVRVSTAIQSEWDIELPVSALLTHSTIAELATLVRQNGQDAAHGPVVTLRRGEADQLPLFLFHPFGGTVFCYVELSRHLPPERPCLAIEAPGLTLEGDAEVSVEEMATRYLGHIREVQRQGPYSLGGWCFGGVIAFEVARQLQAEGERVDLLAAIDSRAPIPANVPESADDATLLSWFARDLAVPFGKSLDIPADELRDHDSDAAFDYILTRAAEIGVLAEDADRAQVLRHFESYLANGIALQTYAPPPADLDLLLLRAVDEPADYGPSLGWCELVKGTLKIVDVPGDHNSVMYAPQSKIAGAIIAEHMEVRGK